MSLKKFLKFRDERDTPKPFLEHVEDLRGMVVRMAIALGICMTLAFVFRGVLASFVQAPLLAVDPGRVDNLQSLGVADSMTISFKLAFYAGLVVSFPVLLYFLAEFVLPALSKKERRVVLLASVVGFGLFLGGAAFATALSDFHARWKDEPLVMDKWFALQARDPSADALDKVATLTAHPDFDARVPNRLRALVATFASANPARFHAEDGSGYRFLADQVLATDRLNQPLEPTSRAAPKAQRLVDAIGSTRRVKAASPFSNINALRD
jgi:hypothetical protein